MSTLLLAYALITLAVVDWVFTALLIWGATRVRETALTERAIASVILSVAATSVAVLAATSVVLQTLELPPSIRFALLVFSLLAISVPQVIWGVLYLTNRFR